MKTRSAKLTDIPAIYALIVDAWNESPFSYIELDEMKNVVLFLLKVARCRV